MTKKRPRSPRKPVTQTDIATKVGCSQNTVALALRDSSRISQSRRQVIFKAAQQLGYRPNLAAQTLRRGRSGLIGLFTGAFDDVRLRYARQFMTSLQSTTLRPLLGMDQTAHKPWFDAPWVQTLRDFQIEALVCFAWHDRPTLPPWHRSVPIVLSGFQPSGDLPCDSISMDRVEASCKATQYLLSKGHQRIDLVLPYEPYYLREGYVQTMRAAGQQPSVFDRIEGETQRAFIDRFIMRLRESTAPTAAFVLATPLAADIANAALAGGLKIPDDIALVGYDYMQWADKMAVPLTTIEQPIDELVAATMRVVCDRVEHPLSPWVHHSLSFHLCQRGST